MSQTGLFDHDERLQALSDKGDPLMALRVLVPWEQFRAALEAVVLTPTSAKKSNAGRKAVDAVLLFRMLVLQALYNLSDEQVEYQVKDRRSFMRFLDLHLEDAVPDATTLWLFREKLVKAEQLQTLFETFHKHLEAAGYIARGGQIIDATIVSVPVARNMREEDAVVKAGKTPEAWADASAKRAQKDTDARWTKKNAKCFFGYKNHVNVDATHKLIRAYDVTAANVADIDCIEGLLKTDNATSSVFADSAYRSAKVEQMIEARGLTSHIHERAMRNTPLTEAQKAKNTEKSRVRVRVEHVFGTQHSAPGGRLVRSIGIARAKAKIGLMNLAYNMRRLVTLTRRSGAPA